MRDLWLNFWKRLWNDESYARGLLRGGLHTLGVSGMGFAGALKVQMPALPNWIPVTIAVASLVATFVAGNVVAGQTNPKP